jgi:predicted RNA-binding protein with PUA-like domain
LKWDFFLQIKAMNYWILKSEPVKYAWEKFVQDGITIWDGVRNYAARNNMREMKIGDICCFYHSNEGKEIVGLAKVVKESYQDPTTNDPAWVVVEIVPYKTLKKPVTLEQMKKEPLLQSNDLIRIGRLSVCKLNDEGYERILKLSEN